MFITNGKSLFGNTGLIISLLILIVLVYFSYNKCYINNNEGFVCNNGIDSVTGSACTNVTPNNSTTSSTPETPSTPTSQPPKSVRIKVSGSSLMVNFTIDISNQLPKSFIIVLAQYDVNKNNTGNNKFYLSNETILNPDLAQNSTINESDTSQVDAPQTSVCTIVNGTPVCQYAFSNLDVKDKSGNFYYYKLGVSAIYNNSNSVYVTPYNISNSNKMFTLGTSIDTQNNNNQSTFNQNSISANTYSDTISTADGQYELIKSQLGNYPDNLLIASQTTNDSTLSDLVDKSMAQALLNINVSTNTPTTSN